MKDGFRSGTWIAAFVFGMVGCTSVPTEDQGMSERAPEPVVTEPLPEPEPVVVKNNAPKQYVVKKGDTLWDIANGYLVDPWRWPELWHVNPQLENPHLIYPGDVLTLIYVDGRPRVQVQDAGVETVPAGSVVTSSGTLPVVKLAPRVRVQPLAQAIPTIPYDAISQFLNRSRVISKNALNDAPYVVSSVDEHLISGAGHHIYVRGVDDPDIRRYSVVRRGEAYEDPDSGEVLGYEAIYLADAQLQREGDPATMFLERSTQEVLNGDRLVPADDGLIEQNYLPHAPSQNVEGRIVGVMGAVRLVGQFQVVAINKGAREKMEPGHVLAVYKEGARVRDPYRFGGVKLPREHAGTIIVFRVFDRVSYALVVDATRAITLHDAVTNP